jgi:hypothetical protein
MAYWSFVKLYTVAVHYLQMCMKEYGCCLKFKRGDNSRQGDSYIPPQTLFAGGIIRNI